LNHATQIIVNNYRKEIIWSAFKIDYIFHRIMIYRNISFINLI